MAIGADRSRAVSGQSGESALLEEMRCQIISEMIAVPPPANRREGLRQLPTALPQTRDFEVRKILEADRTDPDHGPDVRRTESERYRRTVALSSRRASHERVESLQRGRGSRYT